jgi:hypothetical protein
MLIVGLAEITRRYTQTTVRLKEAAAEMRTERLLAGLMREFERADPGTLQVSPHRIAAEIGSREIHAELTPVPGGTLQLEWSSPAISRTLPMPRGAHFELTASGAIALEAAPDEPPLATATPLRTIPFDCEFDTVTRACR